MTAQLKFFEDTKRQPAIPGLRYIASYITQQEHDVLLEQIDRSPWLSDLKRRVQHYGYKYNYKARTIDQAAYLGSLPGWLGSLCDKLLADGIFRTRPDQVIINEYMPGQGISAHIDCTPCFRDIIVSLSLGSGCIMELSNPKTAEKQEIQLKSRSIVVLADEARYVWQHAIPARKFDVINGVKTARTRRVSLTFRNVILEN